MINIVNLRYIQHFRPGMWKQ